MSFYFSGGQRPTSSPTQGPLVDSVRQLTFTDSRGQTSGYSIWAAHIDPDEPVGMLVHLHGDGGYEYKNDPDSWYLTGPTGILTLAQARNMILVIPFTPDREIGEINSETWWEDIVPHVGWAMELTQNLLNTYSVDMGRLWFSGFSGGAEAISHQVIPHHLAELGAHAGGFVILGGGGPPYQVTSTVISSPLKARFPITWVAGENDRPEFAYDGYDGRGTAEAGEAAYRVYGWTTDIVIVPGKQHLLVDGSQGLYGHYIGEAMDAAPAISYTPGTVTELYLGDRPCELYLGSVLIWPEQEEQEEREVVQITLGTGYQARDQLLAALTDRGLDYQTVTEIPFDIELVGTGWTAEMFLFCSALTHAPAMDTSNVTNMNSMFAECYSLTSVPDMDTAQVTDVGFMFYGCWSLTDGNVRLIGKHPNVTTSNMIDNSGLTREPFYDTDGQPWPTAEVHEVSVSGLSGSNTAHPLVTVTVPAGETWSVRVQGTMQSTFRSTQTYPQIRIGSSTSSGYGNNASVDYSGTITSTNRTIALVTRGQSWSGNAGFTGTVTIEK